MKVGDTVVVTNERLEEFYGQRDVIREVRPLANNVGVFLDSGRMMFFEIGSLRKVS